MEQTNVQSQAHLSRGRVVVIALVTVTAMALSVLITPGRVAAQGAGCQFILGFADLRALIGPAVVGECLEDQRFAANGDAQQQTAGGLMAWRKLDNWTAFTDGNRTWLNGPQGLQQRFNSERFSWEGDAIGMQGNRFLRPEVMVAAGTTLYWVNLDREPHNVVTFDLSIESPLIRSGEQWSYTFEQPGRYAYVCDLHANMDGVVIVTAG